MCLMTKYIWLISMVTSMNNVETKSENNTMFWQYVMLKVLTP